MYKIIEVDIGIRSQIDTKGKPNKYGEPKLFKTVKEAQKWIDRKTYRGMTLQYEIQEV